MVSVAPVHSQRLAARLWWTLLPFAGCYGYGKDDGLAWRWWMRFSVVPYLLWRLVARLPGSDPFEPMPQVVCTCELCVPIRDPEPGEQQEGVVI